MTIGEALGVIRSARIYITRGENILARYTGEDAQETAALHHDGERVIGISANRSEMWIELA